MIRISEWTPEREALAALYERLGMVVQAVIAAAGGRPPSLEPSARPVTAAQRARERRRVANHQQLVARVLPR